MRHRRRLHEELPAMLSAIALPVLVVLVALALVLHLGGGAVALGLAPPVFRD